MRTKKGSFVIIWAKATVIFLISSLVSISVMPSTISSIEGADDKPKFDSTSTLGVFVTSYGMK